MYTVVYTQAAEKDIRKLSPEIKILLRAAIELMTDPIRFGRPLRYSLKGCRKLRVGDYRIIYMIETETITVLVIRIAHRREVYERI